MEEFHTLHLDTRPDRYVVRLRRPQVRNALNRQLLTELARVCAIVRADPHPVVIGGGTGYFASGADIRELAERGMDDTLAGETGEVLTLIRNLPVPTVALIDGYALGGGAELAYACDIRVATSRASFGNPEPKLGIIAGAGASYRLRELVGESVAKYMLLTCRRISAEDALRYGLVALVVEPEQGESEVHRLVDDMLKCSPRALAVTKAVVNAGGRDPLVERLAQTALLQDPQRADRINRFLDRAEGEEVVKS